MTTTTINDYIVGFPHEVQEHLKRIRVTIKKAAPEAQETIKYRMPTFVLHENLVHFAAFKNHVGFYPTPSAIEAFKEDLSEYKGGKGSVQFPIDQPMPLRLVERIVKYRVNEIERKRRK